MTVLAFPQPTPADLLITDALSTRRVKRQDLRAEVQAFHELATLVLRQPSKAVQRFLELAMSLTEAGTAGLSVLTQNETGEPVFEWQALAGAFAGFVGGTTPRDWSPCGLCLDAGKTILVAHPARVFTYLGKAEPSIIEGLIVPLFDTGKSPIGTLWVVSHDDPKFTATDARIMEQLAPQLVVALKVEHERTAHEHRIAELRERLADKDTVIREVHHRVKNTIQSAQSLLALQAKGVSSVEANEVLSEAQSRLAVFATVHELLYQTADTAQQVEMAALLGAMTEALRAAFVDRADRVSLTVSAEECLLDPDEAMPLGLIVNEAVTNAFKHAFPGARKGEIKVSFRHDETGSLRLVVWDNGTGLPVGARSGSLGMRLIRSFAARLNGSLQITSDKGTRLRLRFQPSGVSAESPALPSYSPASTR